MNKEYLKSYLYGVEVKIASQITDAVLNRKPKLVIMKEVRNEILGLQLFSDLEKNQLWLWANSFYRHCIAGAARKIDPKERAEAIYSVLRNDTPTLEHVKNEIADTVEFRKKHSDLVEILTDQENHFFYCTEHKDCAVGHQAYQGRLYYRDSAKLSSEEKVFVKSQKLLSVEEVVMEPVWLTTRRNCRHRLIPISFERAKTGDYSGVYNAHEISYDESQYRNYRDRYKMIANIKKVFTNNGVDIPEQLKLDIKRTRGLVRAWMIKKRKGGK